MKLFKKRSKKPHKLVRCATCGGTGMVETYYADSWLEISGGMGANSAKEPCPNCGGSGWIEK
ncbi:MAG: hypothetical protein P8Y70_04815 [Candidatus Lokiarchaeota archaeon]